MATKQAAAQRRALRWAQFSVYAGCGKHLPSARRLRRHHPDYPTFDHVLPRSAGGRRTLTNGLLKHQRCNQARADRAPTGCDLLWLLLVRTRLADRPRSFKPIFAGGSINICRPARLAARVPVGVCPTP
jgi:5-methylcytosine-specific restriction endonuclease McrA